MTISDKDWEAMSEGARGALLKKLLWPEINFFPCPKLTSSWEGMGLVIQRMIELGFRYEADYAWGGTEHMYAWLRKGEYKPAGSATCTTAPSAVALAAYRALVGEKK